MNTNLFNLRVYYEDTDSGGVVYYANYLKFLERARTNLLLDKGFTHTSLKENFKIITVVKSCNIDFIKSAKLDDELDVFTNIEKKTKIQIYFNQKIYCKSKLLVDAKVRIVVLDLLGKITRMPNKLFDII